MHTRTCAIGKRKCCGLPGTFRCARRCVQVCVHECQRSCETHTTPTWLHLGSVLEIDQPISRIVVLFRYYMPLSNQYIWIACAAIQHQQMHALPPARVDWLSSSEAGTCRQAWRRRCVAWPRECPRPGTLVALRLWHVKLSISAILLFVKSSSQPLH